MFSFFSVTRWILSRNRLLRLVGILPLSIQSGSPSRPDRPFVCVIGEIINK